MENLQSLLDSVNAILREEKIKKEESLRRGERFNVFQICGVAHYEVMHSTIIASFLDPKGNHGQKDKFLKAFISTVDDNTGIETSSCSVYKEHVTNEGRIDILIEDKMGKGIIIENKVYATDQSEQLKRYDKFSKGKYGVDNYAIYYLTLDKHAASSDSGKGINYTCISYKQHILNWIEECIKESATTPLIRETLTQYYNHIKQLTNQDMDTKNKEELLKAMANNPNAVAALFNVQEEYKRYAYDNYVKPSLEKFSSEHNLVFKDCNMFKYGEKGFYFYKKEWKTYAIWVYSEKSSCNNDFYWGVSNYQGESIPLESSTFCFGGKKDKTWPYGRVNLEKFSNWDDMNTVASMVNGDFSNYITELILKVLQIIDENKLDIK